MKELRKWQKAVYCFVIGIALVSVLGTTAGFLLAVGVWQSRDSVIETISAVVAVVCYVLMITLGVVGFIVKEITKRKEDAEEARIMGYEKEITEFLAKYIEWLEAEEKIKRLEGEENEN